MLMPYISVCCLFEFFASAGGNHWGRFGAESTTPSQSQMLTHAMASKLGLKYRPCMHSRWDPITTSLRRSSEVFRRPAISACE